MPHTIKAILKPAKPNLTALDMTKKLKPKVYFELLDKLQFKLRSIQQAYLASGDSAVIVLEGWDAAGKGGTIRRMSAVLDPRGFKVWPISAPRRYYLERHYLSRFWERLPPNGAIAVFDRSWYGRVLVERVERIAEPKEWRRAYQEINEFERLLIDNGTRVVKVFMHITPDVQLERFKERLTVPMKRWKLSYEDFRNRDNWDAFEEAIDDMIDNTSTSWAPWYVIPANDKRFARAAVLTIITKQLAKDIDLEPRPIGEDVAREAKVLFPKAWKAAAGTSGRID